MEPLQTSDKTEKWTVTDMEPEIQAKQQMPEIKTQQNTGFSKHFVNTGYHVLI